MTYAICIGDGLATAADDACILGVISVERDCVSIEGGHEAAVYAATVGLTTDLMRV